MKVYAILALLISVSASCASSQGTCIKLENRTLRIDIEKARFFYQCTIVKGRWPFKKKELIKDYYDFTDKEIRRDLKARNFRLKVQR